MRFYSRLLLALIPVFLAACDSGREGALEVAVIDDGQALLAEDLPLSPGARHIRGATQAGLVALDARGEVVPALADQWIVTNDGRSFIFRLRDGVWPGGSPLTSQSVEDALQRRIRSLDGTSLEQDLAAIVEVRAMAGRVVELRLAGPLPHLLQLLAQPELTLPTEDGDDAGARTGLGPMVLDPDTVPPQLRLKPPEERGLPESEDWNDGITPIALRAVTIEEALRLFDDGAVEIVLGGGIGGIPLLETGPLSRGTVRLDPTIGLFGIQVVRPTGPLDSVGVREAIAMSLDRTELLAPFNIGGWAPTTRLVAPGVSDETGLIAERWLGQDIAALRQEASARVTAWRQAQEGAAGAGATILSLSLPEGRGYDLLLRELQRQFADIGLTLVRARNREQADLALIDRVARYPGIRWFLNQFHCSLDRGLCNEDADYLAAQALDDPDPDSRSSLLAEAEAELTLANIYIPFGPPIRWSLVRGTVEGYEANAFAYHPLPPMAEIPR